MQGTHAVNTGTLTTFSLMNIRGLVPRTVPSKIPYIRDLLNESSQLAFGLTETWLSEHSPAELHIPGYTLYRQDRIRTRSRRGRDSGGVALYIRDDQAISSEIVFTYSSGVIEAIGVHIRALNLMMFVLYRQPDDRERGHRSTSREFGHLIEELDEFLSSLLPPSPDIVIMGDFNLPNGSWYRDGGACGATGDEAEMVRALIDFTSTHFLVQQVDSPTHKNGGVLDLIFTNNCDLIHDLNVIPSSSSDHFIIEVSSVYQEPSVPEIEHPLEVDVVRGSEPGFGDLNFFSERIDWDSLEVDLGRCMQQFRSHDLGSSEMMDRFILSCLSVAREFVPLKRAVPKQKHKIPRDRRILMRCRRRTLQQKTTATGRARKEALGRRLIEIEKKLQLSYRQQADYEEDKAVQNIRRNPKFFYTYAKKFSKIKVGIGPLIDATKSLITCPHKMSEMLADQYCSVFSQPQYSSTLPYELFPDEALSRSSITRIIFSNEELEEAMDELSDNAAAGPDGFPAILLKKCRKILAPPLANIWRKSLAEGIVPHNCKTAYISPIHKGQSRALPKNYRPVALTSHLVKVFEKVIRAHIVSFMECHQLFNSNQHGFRGGRSCLSQLLNHFDKVTWYLEHGKPVDVVYLDFAKAFDKVDIGITLRKLKFLGIRGEVGRWLTDFLTDRKQTVLVNGAKSAPRQVASGVPQGSVLGPLLFFILIGDIDQNIASSFISSFADDTRVGRQIENTEDIQFLQADLESVYDWAEQNNMEFNSDKFELLRYRLRGSTVQSSLGYRSGVGSEIVEKSNIIDLGVMLSNDATFSEHINEKVTAVKAKIGWVLRTFRNRGCLLMLTLWKQLILCDLDYCSQLWSPSKTGDIQALELLQRSFVRCINGMRGLNYWEQLRKLRLYSLERRRERYIAIYIWRILEGHVPNFDVTTISSQWHPRRGRECLVPRILSSAPSSIQRVRYDSLPIKGSRIFNSLPQYIRNITDVDVNTFKARLDGYLALVPDEPLIPGYTRYRGSISNSLLDMRQVHVS